MVKMAMIVLVVCWPPVADSVRVVTTTVTRRVAYFEAGAVVDNLSMTQVSADTVAWCK
jgi:hypothetical protein